MALLISTLQCFPMRTRLPVHTFSSFLSVESTSGLNDISVAFSMELLLNELLPQLVIRGTSDHMAGGCYVRAFSPFTRFFLP